VDVYFENVGGAAPRSHSLCSTSSRGSVCGLVSSYNATQPESFTPRIPDPAAKALQSVASSSPSSGTNSSTDSGDVSSGSGRKIGTARTSSMGSSGPRRVPRNVAR
jgi:hypothetical protein